MLIGGALVVTDLFFLEEDAPGDPDSNVSLLLTPEEAVILWNINWP